MGFNITDQLTVLLVSQPIPTTPYPSYPSFALIPGQQPFNILQIAHFSFFAFSSFSFHICNPRSSTTIMLSLFFIRNVLAWAKVSKYRSFFFGTLICSIFVVQMSTLNIIFVLSGGDHHRPN